MGNIRSVITDEQDTDAYPVASLESATINNEKIYYNGLDTGVVARSTVTGYPTTDSYTTPNDYVQKLKGDGAKIGAGILLKVMAGDTINVHAASWWKSNGAFGTSASPLTDIANAITNSLLGISGNKYIASQLGTTVLNPSISSFLTTRDSTYNSSHVDAWLNIVVLDEQLNPVITNDGNNSYYEQVGNPSTANVKQYNVSRPITKSGYVYIYVSNESPNVAAYWDDLQVTHVKGHLLQENSYYPFGLEMKALSSQAALKMQTRYKFNAGTELEDNFDIDYYETFAREYDPQIGRFTGIDALSELSMNATTYGFALNNPIKYNDPWGMKDEAPQPDYSAYWDFVLNAMWEESGEYGGSWSFSSSGGGGGAGTWSGGSYGSKQEAVYDNLGSAMQYWNNQGWSTEGMLNGLSSKGYINTHYGYSSKGNWGIYVSPQYYTQSHTDANGTEWTEGSYYTGYFVKTGDPFSYNNANSRGNDIVFGLIGVSLDAMSKTQSSVGLFTQRMALGYYGNGWGGSQYVNTFKLGQVFGKLSTGLSIYTTYKSINNIAQGDNSVLNYSDAAVGTIGLGAKFWSYFSGVEIPYVGEGVAIYGTVRLGWDVGSIMAEGNAEYIESAKKEDCDICLLDH